MATHTLKHAPAISIVVPVMNEAGNVEELTRRIIEVFSKQLSERSFELIFIDDGSRDETREKIELICKEHNFVVGIFFRRNFGKSAALTAGFKHSRGDIVVTMDGDLQDEPDEIPKLLEKLEEGFDLVSGWKKNRNDPYEKIIASRIFNTIISRVLKLKLNDFNCGFKAYRAWCLKDIRLSGNLYRFLPVFVHRQGGKVTEVPVKHNKRVSGKSKFGFSRYFDGLFDVFTVFFLSSFYYKPMYLFGLISFPLITLGTLSGVYLLGMHLFWLVTGDISYQLNSRPLLTISLGLAGLGLNIFLFGFIAELIIHTSQATESKYFYTIEKTINAKNGDSK
jgi:glycosyltransferase involved in cell wall biosynthesis